MSFGGDVVFFYLAARYLSDKTAAKMAGPGEFMEEIEYENGVKIRSVSSATRAYIRFSNRTSRPINVWWRDFEGKKKLYTQIKPWQNYHINTFLTHPWQFTDSVTGERYVINNQYTFRAPDNVGGMDFRTNWNITVCVRTLRNTSLLHLAQLVKKPEDVAQLNLPKIIATDLVAVVKKFCTSSQSPS